jgi:hypothetical protein
MQMGARELHPFIACMHERDGPRMSFGRHSKRLFVVAVMDNILKDTCSCIIGLMSGLTLGLMGIDKIDLEVRLAVQFSNSCELRLTHKLWKA